MFRNDAFSLRAPKESFGSKHGIQSPSPCLPCSAISLICCYFFVVFLWFIICNVRMGVVLFFKGLSLVATARLILFLFIQVLTEAVRVSQQVHLTLLPSITLYIFSYFDEVDLACANCYRK